ncbi:hypothetical protein HK097_005432, partial [Rhizophlyctis rosea]
SGSGMGLGLMGVIRELDHVKQLHADAQATIERQRKEIDYLKTSLARYQEEGPPLPPRVDSASPLPPIHDSDESPSRLGTADLWNEIRRLEDVVSEMRRTNQSGGGYGGGDATDGGEFGEEDLVRVEKALAELRSPPEKSKTVVSAAPPPPPPGGMGGPPPPPPPGASGGAPPPPPGFVVGRNLNILKTNRPMKPLPWAKIPGHAANGTIWAGVAEEAYSEESAKPVLDEHELADLFAKDESNSPQSMSPETKKEAKKIISLIERKRAQNMGIMLGGLRLSYPTIRVAIVNLDDRLLSVERLQRLRQWAPTEEECDIVRAWEGQVDELGAAEKYIREVMDIPRLAQRLDCMVFWKTFEEEMEEVVPDLDTLLAATEQVRSSKRLRALLQNVLLLGNYLNGTSFRGDAIGFRVDALLALKDTRAAAGNKYMVPTLLHYFAKKVQDSEPDALRFMAELPTVELAARVCIPALFQSIRQLRAGVEAVKAELSELNRLGLPKDPRDKFVDIMQNFRLAADIRLKDAEERAAVAEKNLHDMMRFFGEDPADRGNAPEEFFGIFVAFDKVLQKARKDNEVAERKLKQLAEEEAIRNAQALTDLKNNLLASIGEAGLVVGDELQPMPKFLGGGKARLKPVAGALPFSK